MSSSVTKKQVEEAFEVAVRENSMCSLGRIMDEAGPEVGGVIRAKVDDQVHYSAAVIARVMKGLGFPPVSSAQINKHRQGACLCR